MIHCIRHVATFSFVMLGFLTGSIACHCPLAIAQTPSWMHRYLKNENAGQARTNMSFDDAPVAIVSNGKRDIAVTAFPYMPLDQPGVAIGDSIFLVTSGTRLKAKVDQPIGRDAWIAVRIENGGQRGKEGYVLAQMLRRPDSLGIGTLPFRQLELPDLDRRAALDRSMQFVVGHLKSEESESMGDKLAAYRSSILRREVREQHNASYDRERDLRDQLRREWEFRTWAKSLPK